MGIDRSDLAIRLTEERGRLGYSQRDFASKLGVAGETLRRYETGAREIGAEFLALAVSLGIDVQYVLTGVRSQNLAAAEKAAAPSVSVAGNGTANVVQFAQPGSTVNINHNPRVVNRTIAKVEPGELHIKDEHRAVLHRLVDEIVELEKQVKKAPKTYRAVWGAVNAHCGVTQYVLIPLASFEKAEKYLRQWIGRLNSAASAPLADEDAWRKRRYAYIKINTKDDPEWLKAYLKKTFKVESITELVDNADLDRTYRAVASRKKAAVKRKQSQTGA